MANSTYKKGFIASRKVGGQVNSGAVNAYRIANGYATTLIKGDLVKVSAGQVQKATNGDTVIGVFQGCSYIDATTKQQVQSPVFLANTSSAGVFEGDDNVQALVHDDPDALFRLVVDAPASAGAAGVSAGVVGSLIGISAGAGNTLLGVSGMVGKVTTIGTSATAAAAKIVGIVKRPGFSLEDSTAATEVEVKLINHEYEAV